MDDITYNFIDVEIPGFNPEFFDLWLLEVAHHYNYSIQELSFMFCSDEYLLSINKKYLDHDYYTDVITFNYNEENSLSGDIFISVDRVSENSTEYGNGDVMQELSRVMVHGVLHLLSFKDDTEEHKKQMRAEENRWLKELRFT